MDPLSAEIPLFPLGTVLFQGGTLPLQIFEPRYLDMVSRFDEPDARLYRAGFAAAIGAVATAFGIPWITRRPWPDREPTQLTILNLIERRRE